ncbi:MAG: hypothetical protein JO234_14205 [Hyphomicrobiales bacterium]|nr:hypothetical protein [Hyphomicrobiales bacterium]
MRQLAVDSNAEVLPRRSSSLGSAPSASRDAQVGEFKSFGRQSEIGVPVFTLRLGETKGSVFGAEDAAAEAVRLGDHPQTGMVLADEKVKGVAGLATLARFDNVLQLLRHSANSLMLFQPSVGSTFDPHILPPSRIRDRYVISARRIGIS